MNNYRLKLDGSADAFEELDTNRMDSIDRKTQTVSIKVSKRMLRRMKSIAEIQNEVSNDRILYAFVKTVLSLNRP